MLLCERLASKLAKSAYMTQNNFSHKNKMVPKNAEFDFVFKSVEKVAKRLTPKKLEGRELLHTVLKDKKHFVHILLQRVQRPYCDSADNFMYLLYKQILKTHFYKGF